MKRERSGFTWSYLNSNSPERMGASKRHCVQTSHLGNAATGTPSEDVAFLEKGRPGGDGLQLGFVAKQSEGGKQGGEGDRESGNQRRPSMDQRGNPRAARHRSRPVEPERRDERFAAEEHSQQENSRGERTKIKRSVHQPRLYDDVTAGLATSDRSLASRSY